MIRLLGYTDRLSAAPGDTIRFMVSSESARYEARLVRLIHGDENPAGPGFKQELVSSAFDGDYDGWRQGFPSGSSVAIPLSAGTIPTAFTFAVFFQPTAPGCRASRSSRVAAIRSGTRVGRSRSRRRGELEAVVGSGGGSGPQRVATGVPLDRWAWYLVGLTVDGEGRVAVWQRAVRPGADAATGAARAEASASVASPTMTTSSISRPSPTPTDACPAISTAGSSVRGLSVAR